MFISALLERNRRFAATDISTQAPAIPFIPNQLSFVITCIDPRTEPAGFLGIELGDAIVERVVGGRVTPAILQDVAYISYLVETKAPAAPGLGRAGAGTAAGQSRHLAYRRANWAERLPVAKATPGDTAVRCGTGSGPTETRSTLAILSGP